MKSEKREMKKKRIGWMCRLAAAAAMVCLSVCLSAGAACRTWAAEDLTVTGLTWDEDDGTARWDENAYARYYQVRLFRNDNSVTSTRTTKEHYYEFEENITRKGDYHFEVRAVGKGSEKGEWASSYEWYVTSSEAEDLGGSWQDYVQDIHHGPGVAGGGYYGDYHHDGYHHNSYCYDDYYYGNSCYGGNYSSASRVVGPGISSGGPGVSGSYYSGGTAVSGPGTASAGTSTSGSGTVSAGASTSGSGTVSAGTSMSGSGAASAGRGGYRGPGVSSTGGNHWCMDSHGWWYQYANGTWPRSCWQCIDGSWYCFNDSGYRRCGWISWDNRWYYCGTDGAMMADTTTPDGYYVGADGVWVQ